MLIKKRTARIERWAKNARSAPKKPVILSEAGKHGRSEGPQISVGFRAELPSLIHA